MDKKLAAAIERDNELEEQGMHGDDRLTCWTHQCWAEECANDPLHTNVSALNWMYYRDPPA
ncbi:hypothetical protein [Kitasatospora sp. GP82]|uniref:hypothetical protein n=1 Tax=Kitasatospora sp. GP82 TaxID=3035089 RepID=UPI002474221E|nr:hypothetical protein [Kitasatospora sp. GP82]MDH6126905.1 hypothetical protein [Kitasatospora sp. GP82]